MRIGIIGVGNIGGTLARKLSTAGHDVRVANSRGADGVRDVANDVGATATDTRGAVEGADLVILSIPFPAISDLPSDLFDDVADSVPVIDTGNYYPGMRDPSIEEIDQGKVESVWVSEQIGRPVIKAFNNILAFSLAELGRPSGTPERVAVAVAGDDPVVKQTVMDLVDEVGLEPVDSGSLEESWRQQPATPVYCCDYDAETTRKALAAAVKEEIVGKRDEATRRIMSSTGAITHADMVAANRALNPLG